MILAEVALSQFYLVTRRNLQKTHLSNNICPDSKFIL